VTLRAHRIDVSVPDLDVEVAPTALGPCARYRFTGGELHLLGERLQATSTRPLRLDGPRRRLLGATPDLRRAAFASRVDTVLVSDAGWASLPFPADSATFLADDLVLMTAPSTDGRHDVVLTALDGHTHDSCRVDVAQAVATAVPHPDDGSVVLDLGEGQDGSLLLSVRVEGQRLEMTEVGRNSVAASFSPDGTRLLLMPHPSIPAAPAAVSWPDQRRRFDLSDDSGRDFDLYGCHLDDDRVLLSTYGHGLVVSDRDLTGVTPLVLDGLTSSVEVSSLHGLGRDVFAATTWVDGTSTSGLWQLTGADAAPCG
jgi:hypothetical protein